MWQPDATCATRFQIFVFEVVSSMHSAQCRTAPMNRPVEITAIITAFERIDQTIETIQRIESCLPRPDEILVHVDGNRRGCANAIRAACPGIEVQINSDAVGPGGGRNLLVSAARHDLIASFDDDSYPIDTDFFARVQSLSIRFPNAVLFGASIYHRGEPIEDDKMVLAQTSSFGAGGVCFRREAFLAAGGFVPLVVAYGMEEEDLSLRWLDQGAELVETPWLRVFHDTDLVHHESALINGAVIANLALLAWLRYPVRYFPYALLQLSNRIIWCLRVGRRAGLASGLAAIPEHIFRHGKLREPVSTATMKRRKLLRRGMSAVPFSYVTDVKTEIDRV